ncbi:type I-E CRISPR-associated protein Cse2/CasB [Streptomyces sp. ME02-7008A-1]|uniref:type I-E CRISPR-associated protein Cse2/CasB n=1 Tax=unclassified Streptomyces TaxID=2593676 RepID=UPI0029A11ED5|nr:MULTISPECIES: type I-E CRISPR-associated protein Cse2/CasB [unclassified Streptomyces]MDX3180484.1 type I-E CRISPR-associated protein Cse2/CasB [Streptomyces sp. ME02-7008A-1]MDX3301225.1 type I-E CRISPR-associated protein Cse2/CasB [Streptomyces sp. ME02-7008A]
MTDSTAAAAPPKHDRFISYVHELCQDNRTRAELRRGLGLTVERCNYMHRYLVPWLHQYDDVTYPDTRRAYYGVASLIAARPRIARQTDAADTPATAWYLRPNLGSALGEAVRKDVIKAGTAESALHLMSRQSSDAVHRTLPSLTRQLLSGGIAVDWAVLLKDLSWWTQDRDVIATRWLDQYFRRSIPTGVTDTTTTLPEENER